MGFTPLGMFYCSHVFGDQFLIRRLLPYRRVQTYPDVARRLRVFRLHSPRGSNWDPGKRLTLLGLVRETLGITDRPLTAPTLATVAICLCAAQCCCCIGCGRHSDRVYVAMVAQDLVRFKTAQYSQHAIPFVHGSGAVGLKTTNLHTNGLGSHSANLVPLSTQSA